MGGTYVLLGMYTDAIAALDRSIAIRPTADALSNLATAYFNLRQYDDAAKTYEAATKMNDRDYEVWGNLAAAYHYSGRNQEKSVAAYQKAISLASADLKINPNDSSVLRDIAGYESMLGNRAEAMSYLSKAFHHEQRDDPELLFSGALIYNQFGNSDEALRLLRKALDAGFSPSTVATAPALSNLHSNATFQQLIQQKSSK